MTALYATLERGEEAELRALQGEVLSIRAPRAFAPGQPVALTARLDARALPLSGKTLGSKRRDDGGFEVRVRLVNLRKRDRQVLRARLGDG